LTKNQLKKLIHDRKKILTICGLGNVGGPIATAWLRAEAKVIGVDISYPVMKTAPIPMLLELMIKFCSRTSFS